MKLSADCETCQWNPPCYPSACNAGDSTGDAEHATKNKATGQEKRSFRGSCTRVHETICPPGAAERHHVKRVTNTTRQLIWTTAAYWTWRRQLETTRQNIKRLLASEANRSPHHYHAPEKDGAPDHLLPCVHRRAKKMLTYCSRHACTDESRTPPANVTSPAQT